MAFVNKTEQLRVMCVSLAIEADRKIQTNFEIGKIICDAEDIYKWVIRKETECPTTN